MAIRKADNRDIQQIALLHKSQFPTHFLGRYSVKLIGRFYENFIVSSVFLVNENKLGKIDGFVLGGSKDQLNISKNKFIKTHKFNYIFETILLPTVYLQALSKVVGMFKLQISSEHSVAFTRLLSISVNDDVKGTGVAVDLLRRFELSILPVKVYGLSVKKDNARAIKFYYKNGFETEKETGESIYLVKRLTYSTK